MRVRAGTIVVLLFCLLRLAPLPAGAAEQAPAGLPNFHRVAAGIYRGAAPARAGLDALRDLGVKTIIDLRIEQGAAKSASLTRSRERALTAEMGFSYVSLPMGREAPTAAQVKTLLAALAAAGAVPVYVHCQHGADRTGCMIGIYRVQVQGWTFARAWQEMRQYGFKPWLAELKEAVRVRAKPAAGK